MCGAGLEGVEEEQECYRREVLKSGAGVCRGVPQAGERGCLSLVAARTPHPASSPVLAPNILYLRAAAPFPACRLFPLDHSCLTCIPDLLILRTLLLIMN